MLQLTQSQTFLYETPLAPELYGISTESFLKVRRFIVESGDFAFSTKKEERNNIKSGQSDITTKSDVLIETKFETLVRNLFPEAGFVGEEDLSLHHKCEYSWYIDPIDGTHYFSRGVPLWSIAIALVHNNKPVIGLIYNPSTGDLYEAQEGCGAYLNGERLLPLTTSSATRGRMLWDYVQWHSASERTQGIEPLFQDLRSQFDFHVSMVSGSLSLAFMSQGAFVAFVDPYRSKSKFVDIAAGLLLVSEVGYEIHRKSLSEDAEEIIAATPEVVERIKSTISRHM